MGRGKWDLFDEKLEVMQILGRALRFPRYMDDLDKYPDATEKDGVRVAHIGAVSLARMAAAHIQTLEEEVVRLKEEATR